MHYSKLCILSKQRKINVPLNSYGIITYFLYYLLDFMKMFLNGPMEMVMFKQGLSK
jgi:hypothetical protein